VERKGTADVIGYCGLTVHGNGSPDEPELAYELLRAAHGRGYATEAGRAVVTWASEAGYRRLWAGVWDWNAASRRVLVIVFILIAIERAWQVIGGLGSRLLSVITEIAMHRAGGTADPERPNGAEVTTVRSE
jgi:GNAT superfamily N-acetyltransferase